MCAYGVAPVPRRFLSEQFRHDYAWLQTGRDARTFAITRFELWALEQREAFFALDKPIVDDAKDRVSGIRQQVTASWYALQASKQAIISARAQVAASAGALDGVNQEYLVGSRSTIDVLNAEQELFTARVTQIVAEHDQVVASYQLLSSIGHLTARHLGLGGGYYDAKENYNNVKGKWFGLEADTIE